MVIEKLIELRDDLFKETASSRILKCLSFKLLIIEIYNIPRPLPVKLEAKIFDGFGVF